MLTYWINSKRIVDNIYIPKYYDPELNNELTALQDTHYLLCIGGLIDDGTISVQTGHEIGKMAYGTGNIPFVRTSDISNWEINTVPKQGVSEDIHKLYESRQDIKERDILLVRDGSYLIGTNCFVTKLDLPMLFQSHILKFRVLKSDILNPYLLFLSLNNSIVQKQIRNFQFTADIIDTLGGRFRELILPIPKDNEVKICLSNMVSTSIVNRIKSKAAIKQMPVLIEDILRTQDIKVFDDFFQKSIDDIISNLTQDTTTLELGEFIAYWMKCSKLTSSIFLPKYYDPAIDDELNALKTSCDLVSIGDLVDNNKITLSTGDEIGKMAYGTGSIPFVRTSDFANWEIKVDAKQGVSEEIYNEYKNKQDVKVGDILLVRDGTYLVGNSCIVTKSDEVMLFCGGLYKLRSNDTVYLSQYLLLGLLNSYIVKKQFRTKQFTRDIIDTLGKRIKEVIIPIPKDESIRTAISNRIQDIINIRIQARDMITHLSDNIIEP